MIAERLKGFREEKGYSQEGMAKVAKMSQRAWGGWERTAPKALWSLVALARHFDTSADYLLALTDIAEPKEAKTLPEGGSELLQQLSGLSERARSELLMIARAIYEEDQRWVQYGVAVDALESTLGEDFAEQLQLRLATLTAELGSESAAIAHIRASILGEVPPQDQGD